MPSSFRIMSKDLDIEIDYDRPCLWIYAPQATVKVALDSVTENDVSVAFERIIRNVAALVPHCELYCGGHVEVCPKHNYQDPEDGPGCPDCRRESYDAALKMVRAAWAIWFEVRWDLRNLIGQEVSIRLSDEWIDEHVMVM